MKAPRTEGTTVFDIGNNVAAVAYAAIIAALWVGHRFASRPRKPDQAPQPIVIANPELRDLVADLRELNRELQDVADRIKDNQEGQ